MRSGKKILCPSARCNSGASLLGIRTESGKVAILPQVLPIDEVFVYTAKESGIPEERFRFVNNCIEARCIQWNGKRCGIADSTVQYIKQVEVNNDLPACSIRNQCRWFVQTGPDACKVCPYVITHITETEIDAYFHKET